MVSRRGISLLDLAVGLPAGGATALLPDEVRNTLESLAVLELTTTTTPAAYVHQGVSQSIGDEPLALPQVNTWAVESPVLTTGLPFRVVRLRGAAGAGAAIEAQSTTSTVDLYLDPIGFTFPRLTPAIVAGGAFGSTNAAHLVPDPDRDGVRAWGRAILRITLGPPLSVSIIDWPDPFSPVGGAGVAELTFDPPSFLFDASGFGATVDRVVVDVSQTFTPADVVARGHDQTWQGISLREGALYLPRNAPIVGDLSMSLRDLLVGIPPSEQGLQGEAVIEFGRTPVNPTVVEFLAMVDGEAQSVGVEANAAGYALVSLPGAVVEAKATLPGEVAELPADATVDWVLPDGTRRDDSPTTGWFTARAGESMRATFTELVGDDRVPGEEQVYVFTLAASGGVEPADLPTITLTAGATTIERVASVSGSTAALAVTSFSAVVIDGDSADATWQLGEGATAQTGTGATFSPRVETLALGRHDLVLRHGDSVRRCEVQVLDAGDLIVGAFDGPRDAGGAVLAVSQILATYDLMTFDREGRRVANGLEAVFGDGDAVDVPEGALAHVTIGTERLVPPELRHVQVLMLFNQAASAPDLFLRPDGSFVDAPTYVGLWADSFDGAVRFLVIGRCCDLGDDAYNDDLASRRADLAATWIDGTIGLRSEQDLPAGDAVAIQSDAVTAGLLSDEEAAAHRLITVQYGAITGTDSTTPPRPQYRRVDIYAVGGEPTDATPAAHGELMPQPEQRETLLPGTDAPRPIPPSPRNAKLPFRTRLTIGWDSPSVHEPADAVPTLAELLLEWPASDATISDVVDDPVTPVPNDPTTEVFTLVGRWTHDPQSGQTMFTLSWDSSGDPDGLAHLDSTVLAFVLAVGPALIGGIDPAPDSGDGNQAGVKLLALATAGLAASVFVSSGRVVLNGIEYQVMPLEGGPVQRLVVDYAVEIGFDTALLESVGIHVHTDADHPMRVRYRNVGLELDLSGRDKPWYESISLVYDDVSLEVEDPGSWTIDGVLGDVLRVVGTRAGSGSTWVEVDLEFLVDLGVVTISKCTVRVTIDGDGTPHVELRGITVTVDVPNTLTGSGTLAIGADDVFHAGIDVLVVPANLRVGAALAFEPETSFFFLEIKAILPVGIPLGPSGLGLYGFVGRFVTNGTRDLDAGERDLVARELGWYRTAPELKYRPEPGQWALGLGAVVGTALDTGFSFNALGMFVVSFPDPSVIFSIEAKFLSSPAAPSDDPGDGDGASGQITGLAVIDDEAVVIAVDGSYNLPDVIDLRVPVSAYFPGSADDSYVRIGADGYSGRAGDPVTATLLPGTLDANVWSYLMVEGGSLRKLGGDPRFSFEGFCIGFGAGWSVEWEAGPVSLRASAKVLVGLGTKPFMLVGGVFVDGELSLSFLSIGASGELVITIQDDTVSLEGEFCATFDFGFFEKEGRVPISIGPSVSVEAPPPPAPLLKASFCDRNGFVIQQVDSGKTTADAPVWPDTVPVLEFAHPLTCELPDDAAFDPGPPPAGPEWSGTSKLKYAFRLSRVQIETGGEALEAPLDSAWWWSTFRPGVLAEGDLSLSAEEGRWLALLTWDPRPWSRLLGDGATATPGEPSDVVSRLCDPAPLPVRGCAFGVSAVRIDSARIELRNESVTATLPSRFGWLAREHFGLIDLSSAVVIAARRGWALQPGRTRLLPQLAAVPELPDEAAGVYELAVLADGLGPVTTMQVSGTYEPALLDPSLTLLVLPWERDPISGVVFCSDFSNPSSVEFTTDGFDFKGLHFVDLSDSGDGLTLVENTPPANVPELRFSRSGVRIDLPLPVHGVRVDVRSATSADILAEATDDDGVVVVTAVCPAKRRRTLRLLPSADSGDLIRSVTLTGGGGEGMLISICFVDPLLPEPDNPPPEGLPFPLVVGTRVEGLKVPWVPTKVATVDLAGVECPVVRYDPPRAGRTWVASTILPWLGGRVGVIEACGVNTVAQQIVDDQAEYVETLVEQWNARVAEFAPERRSLLEPATSYTLRVSWQYQAWVATDEQPAPLPTDPDGWIDAVDDITWNFSTAAVASDAAMLKPVDVRDEAVFDPRAVSRYLLGIEPPGGDTTTHFRADPIFVHFAVDHVEQLLDLYERTLSFSIQRTDPPPGTAAQYPSVLMNPTYVGIPRERMNAADDRFVAAAATLPCVDLPAIGGTTAVLGEDVSLEPRARYDVRLAAPSTETGTSEVLIEVVNFIASRYASPAELLAALGCVDPISPILPNDAIIAAEPPRGATSLLTGDAALDATLVELGLDPWPLAVRPRVVALWRPAGELEWHFEGVLIEADEAVVRDGRLTVETITLGSRPLDVVRVSSSGARLLATPSEPLTLAAEDVLTVALASITPTTAGTTVTDTVVGSRRILDRPRLAYQELA